MPAERPDPRELAAWLCAHPRLRPQVRELEVRAGKHVIRQGEACTDVFVLRSGLVKIAYLTHDGKERVKSFIADAGLFGSRSAQMDGQGSPFAALCLEDSALAALPYPAFRDATLADPALMRAVFGFNEWLAMKKERREYDLLCRSAEERYRVFLAQEPSLAGRLTQGDIARYLGITPVALSRIRRRLAQ
ncbi:MAG TPA: Crp/Fnr family transcriptional regulator [Pseudoxanthomonas sp.]|nr:Crp/Fnr family transcriptional regulator [Pseudoxanthomonas sp.]